MLPDLSKPASCATNFVPYQLSLYITLVPLDHRTRNRLTILILSKQNKQYSSLLIALYTVQYCTLSSE